MTGRGDLVADVTAGRQKLDAVKDDDLPDALRADEPAQRQAEIDKQTAERKSLNARDDRAGEEARRVCVEQRNKAPEKHRRLVRPRGRETLKAQIKR